MAEDSVRYSRMGDILDLLLLMQRRLKGVSIEDIQQEYEVSRSTAERMLECIKERVPQVDLIENHSSKKKYWGFKSGYMTEIITFSTDEIANLEKMKTFTEYSGFEDKEKLFQKTLDKIKIFNKRYRIKVDDEVEAMLQTEGYAVKQVPKFNIDINTLSIIREALKENRKITATYHNKPRVLEPYGLIYGEKIYLIAGEKEKGTIPYCYILHKLSDVKITRETFDKGDFNLEEYSKVSFGVYHGEVYDVKLLFSKEVADDVLNYNFHSTQKIKQNEDGTVTVKFKASGEYEMIWHLFRWGTNVRILSPKSLKKQYIEHLTKALEKQNEK